MNTLSYCSYALAYTHKHTYCMSALDPNYSRVVKFNLITAKFGCLCQLGKEEQNSRKYDINKTVFVKWQDNSQYGSYSASISKLNVTAPLRLNWMNWLTCFCHTNTFCNGITQTSNSYWNIPLVKIHAAQRRNDKIQCVGKSLCEWVLHLLAMTGALYSQWIWV